MTHADLSDFVVSPDLSQFEANPLYDERMRDFQVKGAKWLRDAEFAALLADQMGTGKSVQALMACEDNPIIVCPAVAKGVWANEVLKWRDDLVPVILDGHGMFRFPVKNEAIIVNYDILPDKFDFPSNGRYNLIPDEAHMLKSGSKTNRTRRFRALSRGVRKGLGKVYGLTGSPILNHPLDMWHILVSLGLEKIAFGSFPNFKRLYNCERDGRGVLEWGMPTPGVKTALATVMLRRLRKDVLKELPGKIHQDIPVKINRKTMLACDKALAALKERGISFEKAVNRTIETEDGDIGFSEISNAEMLLAVAKIPAMLEVVEQFEQNDEPLIVFSAHTAPIEALNKRKGWIGVTGSTVKGEDRFGIVERFQRGELRGLGFTIRSGGVALTMTRACHALFVDQDWVPEMNNQAEDRLDRFGQMRGVLINRLIADHYMDRLKAASMARKMQYIEGSYAVG